MLVAALLSSRGAPAEILTRWLSGWFDIVVSPLLLAEVERALAYERVAQLVTVAEARAFLAALRRHAVVAEDPRAGRAGRSGRPRRRLPDRPRSPIPCRRSSRRASSSSG